MQAFISIFEIELLGMVGLGQVTAAAISVSPNIVSKGNPNSKKKQKKTARCLAEETKSMSSEEILTGQTCKVLSPALRLLSKRLTRKK